MDFLDLLSFRKFLFLKNKISKKRIFPKDRNPYKSYVTALKAETKGESKEGAKRAIHNK